MSNKVAYSPKKDDLFNPGRREGFFDEGRASEAVLCANMARLAYCRMEPEFEFDRSRIQENLKRVGFTSCDFFESHGTAAGKGIHCFLALRETGERTAIVAFRGTDVKDLHDLWYDIDCEQILWSKGGRVHKGFSDALAQVQQRVLEALQSIGNSRLVYTGHSLGAAMATLLASLLPPYALYTFGSPRVGDAAFAATVANLKSYRYVDCCDRVAQVPPEFMGYKHVGDPYYIDRRRIIRFNPGVKDISADQSKATVKYWLRYSLLPGNVWARGFADHAPVNYIWPIAAAEPERGLAAEARN